ncbi:hypothetical protein LZ31DRAFT_559192 [Colletotrichum somersetense]|nr:hypothetical protein LZ31DRAFT_559192 [Colletotrichum somersetense]
MYERTLERTHPYLAYLHGYDVIVRIPYLAFPIPLRSCPSALPRAPKLLPAIVVVYMDADLI